MYCLSSVHEHNKSLIGIEIAICHNLLAKENMKIKILIALSLCLSIVSDIIGQNDSAKINSAVTIQAGLDYISFKDRTFSPIVFSGTIPEIRLSFNQNRKDRRLWSTNISISSGNIDYMNKYFSSSISSLNFSFNYLAKFASFGRSKFYLGGQFGSAIDLINYENFASGAWFTAQKLEPILIYRYKIKERQSISGKFSFPIVSLVGRPSYAGVDEFVVVNSDNIPKILYSRMKVYSLNKLVNPDFELRYSYVLRRFAFSVSVSYSYLQVNSIRKYYKNELGLNIGFQVKIGK